MFAHLLSIQWFHKLCVHILWPFFFGGLFSFLPSEKGVFSSVTDIVPVGSNHVEFIPLSHLKVFVFVFAIYGHDSSCSNPRCLPGDTPQTFTAIFSAYPFHLTHRCVGTLITFSHRSGTNLKPTHLVPSFCSG